MCSSDLLHHVGPHYSFTRLQPFFNPGPHAYGPPQVWLGGVNERICELGGSHSEGFVTHPTNSNPRYLREFCLPRLEASAAATDRPCPQVVTGSMFVTGPTAADVDASREHHRAILAFLYTTPAYRRSLGLFGWNELGERLQAMTRAGEWDRLSSLMTDEVLHALVPQATWDQLPAVVDEWFGGLVDGVMLPVPADPANDARFAEVIAAIRGSGI